MYPGKSSYATPKSYAAPPTALTHQPLESPSSATLYSRQQQQQLLHQQSQYQSRQLQQPKPSHSQPSQQQPRTEPSPLLSTLALIPPIGKSMPGLYSTSGFDVLGVLSRVASRANPRTTLGPVDFSCSFLVVVRRPVFLLFSFSGAWLISIPLGCSQVRLANRICLADVLAAHGLRCSRDCRPQLPLPAMWVISPFP